MEMFYSDEEKQVFELFPDKSKEELIPILEESIAEGGYYEEEICGSVLRKIKMELAGE